MAINTKCNNRCIWCYDKASQKQDFDMSDQTFDTVLSLIKQAGCKHLTFLGGEPTLHPKLWNFVRKATINGLATSIVSNGSGYSDVFLETIEDIKESVVLNISIEGATAKIHDEITKTKGSFGKLLNGIQSAKSKNFGIAAIMTLCKSNMHELTDVIKLLEEMQVKAMLINFANPPLNVFYDESVYLTVEEFCEQISTSVKNITYSIDIAVGPPLPRCQFSASFSKMLNKNKIHLNTGCQLLFGGAITIDSVGNILLCNHLTEVKTENINSFSNVEEFQSFLRDIDFQMRKTLQKYPLKKCNKCNESEKCFGGCPLLYLE